MRKPIGALILVFLSFSVVYGQSAQTAVNSAEKKAVIEALCKNLEQEYIFPDVTAKYVQMLRDNLQSGKYEGIGQPGQFAATVTHDLMSVHRDLHLSVRFNPNWVKEERNRKELDEAAIRRNERRSRTTNYGFNEIKILPGNIGYLRLNEFTYDTGAQDAAVGAMSFLSNADALIIDLRGNGGGSPEMVQFLCSYFLGNPRRHLNSFSYKDIDKLTQYWTYTYLPGKRLDKADLYLLTSESTFSAAEEFTYNLKNLKRATVIGETTGGGAHDNKFVILSDNFMMSLPFARAINPVSKTNWEEVGVEPDIKVSQNKALATALAMAGKKLAEKEKDPEFKAYYQWYFETYNAALNPASIETEALRSYVGTYGPRTITLEGGSLFYQRQGQAKRKMIPLAEDYFLLDGNENFRLKFLKEGDRIVAVEGRNPGGAADKHLKNK
ncbi:MAG: S41 family peptidase [Acidobacteriota bacterium]|nr:S41 family peptidase [Acidobacteriota bacterium]